MFININKVLLSIFFFFIVFLPFNSVIRFSFLGELGAGISPLLILCALPLFVFFVYRRNWRVPKGISVFIFLFYLFMMFQFLILNDSLGNHHLKGEFGFSRFVKSYLVLFYGFYIALFAYYVFLIDFKISTNSFIFISIVCVFIGFLELASWQFDFFYNLYIKISRGFLHVYNGRGEYVVGKLQSVTFEGSSYGYFVSFLLPWCIYYFKSQKAFQYKVIILVVIISLFVQGGLSGSTGLFSVLGFIFLYVVFYFSITRNIFYPIVFTFLFISILPLVLISINSFVDMVVIDMSSISMQSRLGTFVASFKMFTDNSIIGVGLGQYGFNVESNIPFWAMNYEFYRWLEDPDASFFPTFSVLARILGELGIIGLILWISMIFYFIQVAWNTRCKENIYLVELVIVSLMMSVLMQWSLGSFKLYAMWIAFGLSCYLRSYYQTHLKGFN